MKKIIKCRKMNNNQYHQPQVKQLKHHVDVVVRNVQNKGKQLNHPHHPYHHHLNSKRSKVLLSPMNRSLLKSKRRSPLQHYPLHQPRKQQHPLQQQSQHHHRIDHLKHFGVYHHQHNPNLYNHHSNQRLNHQHYLNQQLRHHHHLHLHQR